MQLTKKRKLFLYRLLKKEYALGALDSYYDMDLKKKFKEEYGLTLKEAADALDALLEFLTE